MGWNRFTKSQQIELSNTMRMLGIVSIETGGQAAAVANSLSHQGAATPGSRTMHMLARKVLDVFVETGSISLPQKEK